MKKKKSAAVSLVVLLIALLSLFVSRTGEDGGVRPASAPAPVEGGDLVVYFLDVGQADSALLLCDGESMLVDGGNVADSSFLYSFLLQHGVSHLNYIVGTHAHEDHIGGLSGALNYATVDTVYCSVRSYDSKAFSNFVKYTAARGASIEIPRQGDSFSLGGAEVTVLGPAPAASYDEENNMSLVLRVVYGQTQFLFTGDAEEPEESDILAMGYPLSCTVLKVAHHGSNTSTSDAFLRAAAPDYAVISCGRDNSYGHPHEETLRRLNDAGVVVYRTDLQGTIACVSDGTEIAFYEGAEAEAGVPVAVSTP